MVLFDETDVTSQIEQLSKDGAGEEAYIVFSTLRGLVSNLDVEDQGRLGLLNSRNHARLVHRPRFGQCVLKVTVVPVGQETQALQIWNDAGLGSSLVPRLYECGVTVEGWGWTLQEKVPGVTSPVNQSVILVREALSVLQQLHVPAPPSFPSVFPLLDERLEVLSHFGDVTNITRIVLSDCQDAEEVLLHGDYASNNVLSGPEGIRVIGPVGLRGPKEYDAARWIARSDSNTSVALRFNRLVPEWADKRIFAAFLSAELLEMAGWRAHSKVCKRTTTDLIGDVRYLLDAYTRR